MSQTTESQNSQWHRGQLGPWSIAALLMLCTWPVLGVGSLIFGLGTQAITQQKLLTQRSDANLAERVAQQQRRDLSGLLMGIGGIAFCAGGLTLVWAKRNLSRMATPSPSPLTVPDTPEAMTSLVQQMNPVIRQLYRAADTKEALKFAVAEVRSALGADRVVVYSLDAESQGVFTAESVVNGWPRALGDTIHDPCFDALYTEKYQDGRVQAISDIHDTNLTPCHLEQLERFEVKANLVAPILNDGNLKGLLIAHQCAAPRQWHPFEMQWFTQIAIAIGLALDNFQYRMELHAARQRLTEVTDNQQQHLDAFRLQLGKSLNQGNIAINALVSEQQQQQTQSLTSLASIRDVSNSVADMTTAAEQALQQHQSFDETLQRFDQSIAPLLARISTLEQAKIKESETVLKRLTPTAQKLIQKLASTHQLINQIQLLAKQSPIEATQSGLGNRSLSNVVDQVHVVTQQLDGHIVDLKASAAQIQVVAHHATALLGEADLLEIDAQELQLLVQQLQQLKIACAQMRPSVQKVKQSILEQAQTSSTASHSVHGLVDHVDQMTELADQLAQTFAQVDTALRPTPLDDHSPPESSP